MHFQRELQAPQDYTNELRFVVRTLSGGLCRYAALAPCKTFSTPVPRIFYALKLKLECLAPGSSRLAGNRCPSLVSGNVWLGLLALDVSALPSYLQDNKYIA